MDSFKITLCKNEQGRGTAHAKCSGPFHLRYFSVSIQETFFHLQRWIKLQMISNFKNMERGIYDISRQYPAIILEILNKTVRIQSTWSVIQSGSKPDTLNLIF
jgi:hypothetical protein